MLRQGVVTLIRPVELFATGIKIFDLCTYLYRCWVVVREKESQLIVLSQTQYPKLAAVRPQLQPTTDGKMELHITAPDMSPIIVPEELPPSASTVIVRYVYIYQDLKIL